MHHISCSFLVKHEITQVTQPLYSPDCQPVTPGCSQNWNHLWKGRDIRLLVRCRIIRWGSCWQLGELVRFHGVYFEADWGILSYVQYFLHFISFPIISHFSHKMMGYFLEDLIIYVLWLIPSPSFIQFTVPLSSLLTVVSLFHVSMPLFLLCKSVYWIPHVSEIIWYSSFSDWLISISIILCRSIHAATKGTISFFLQLRFSEFTR